METIRESTGLPVGVGFGIKDPQSAQAIAGVGDAVIVGSALIRRIEERLEKPESIVPAVAELLAGMRSAMDSI